jgi:hypothetical protein
MVVLGVRDDGRQYAPLAVDWPSADRPAWQREERVAPGTTGNFTFRVRAPDAVGTYEIPLRLVVDGVTWLEDEPVVARLEVVAWNDAPLLLVADAFAFAQERVHVFGVAFLVLAVGLAAWLIRRRIVSRI